MNFILKFSPAFLKKFDQYLRLNHTWIWATRIHLNLYFSVLLSLFFIALGLLYQMDPKNVVTSSQQDFFFGILFIPAVILMGFFIYNMSIYNPDKNSGYRFRYQEFFVLLIYYCTLSLPLLIPYPTSWVLNERIANIEDKIVLEKQAVSLELGAYCFPNNRHNYAFYPNDSIFLSSLTGDYKKVGQNAAYYEKIQLENEAWIKLKDSIFDHKGVFKNQRPHLYFSSFIQDYHGYSYYGNYGNSYIKSDLRNFGLQEDSIFKFKKKQLVLYRNEGLAKDYINKFGDLLLIYSDLKEVNTAKVFLDYSQNIYFPSYVHKVLRPNIQATTSNMHQIRSAQLKSVTAWNLGLYQGLALAVFCICLLFQIFKNTHWSQLLRSILFIGLIYTIVLVVDASAGFNNGLTIIFPFYSFIILAIISILGFGLKKFSTFYVQINIYLSVISPFFFLILLGYLENVHQFFYWSWFDSYKEINHQGLLDYSSAHYVMIQQWYNWALWIGIFGYVFIWNSYLKSLYLRYWSLPKNT